GIALADYFTPFNQQYLADNDQDLGCNGGIVLPDEVGSVSHRHLFIGSGKEGSIYLVDRDNMGHYHGLNNNQIVQQVSGQLQQGLVVSPAYFNHRVYYSAAGDLLEAFPLTNAVMGSTPDSTTLLGYAFPSPVPTVSANGTNNGIVWAIQADAYASQGPAILHA